MSYFLYIMLWFSFILYVILNIVLNLLYPFWIQFKFFNMKMLTKSAMKDNLKKSNLVRHFCDFRLTYIIIEEIINDSKKASLLRNHMINSSSDNLLYPTEKQEVWKHKSRKGYKNIYLTGNFPHKLYVMHLNPFFPALIL